MATSATNETHRTPCQFPEIILDTTLADLLAEDDSNVHEALCNFKPCADPRHRVTPVNQKYLITSTNVSDDNDLAHLQLENVTYLLSFWAGHMEISMMAWEGWSSDGTLTSETLGQNAHEAFSVLSEKQRPLPNVFSNRDDFVKQNESAKTQVRWGFAVDFAEQIPSAIHPTLHYRLNCKRWLADCPLRSANDRILDPGCTCEKHTTEDGLWYFGTDCETCKAAVKDELSQLKDRLLATEPPFVLKMTQALGSVGIMLVKTKADRDKTIKRILEVQTESLPRINAENASIHPASLVLSDFLPGDTVALNFYVRRDGSVRFLGACQQLSTRTTEGGKQHTALTWHQQSAWEQKYSEVVGEIGRVLHDEEYLGPCGADVMETESGTQYVIDLNVRTSTSTILGCLGGHCKSRGFDVCAVYECLLPALSREDLGNKFKKEIEEGRLILLGITRLGKKNRWAYPVVLAGEDQEAVKELGARVLEFEASNVGNVQEAGGT